MNFWANPVYVCARLCAYVRTRVLNLFLSPLGISLKYLLYLPLLAVLIIKFCILLQPFPPLCVCMCLQLQYLKMTEHFCIIIVYYANNDIFSGWTSFRQRIDWQWWKGRRDLKNKTKIKCGEWTGRGIYGSLDQTPIDSFRYKEWIKQDFF